MTLIALLPAFSATADNTVLHAGSEVSTYSGSLPLHQRIVGGVKEYVTNAANEHVSDAGVISDIEISVQSIDQRLQLKPCSNVLSFEGSASQRLPGRAMIKVSCRSNQPWSLYVPATVSWVQPVVMTKLALQRGQDIGAGDVYIEQKRISRPGVQYVHSADQVIGKMAARRLAANKPVDWRFLEQANLVRKGETVQLLAQSGSIAISMDGKALSNGTKGEQIRVRNTLSNRVVEALVVARGKAEVRL